MLCLAGSDVICYSTDEYAEGYFGTPFEEYDHNDEVLDIYTEVQIHALPLHLRTIKAIERILLRYCVVHTIDDDCLSSKSLDCVSYAYWVQRGTMFPQFIVIRVTSRFSQDSAVLSSMVQKHVQTYCVAITVKKHGCPHPTPKYQIYDDTFFFF
jgi:hypothetical protein